MYPKALRTWFYPGANNGLEFLYPKDQLATIAAHRVAPAEVQTAAITTPEPVTEPEVAQPVAEPETAQVVTEPEVTQTADLGNLNDKEQEQVQEQTPVTEEQPTQIAQNDTERPITDQNNERELPRTAGELPMIGLIGMLCLGFGLGLRVLSVRS